jgi:carbon storage regulator
MLILSRHVNEKILIGDNIEITVVRIVKNRGTPWVGIGIDAPPGVRIDRREVRQRILAEQRQPVSAGSSLDLEF